MDTRQTTPQFDCDVINGLYRITIADIDIVIDVKQQKTITINQNNKGKIRLPINLDKDNDQEPKKATAKKQSLSVLADKQSKLFMTYCRSTEKERNRLKEIFSIDYIDDADADNDCNSNEFVMDIFESKFKKLYPNDKIDYDRILIQYIKPISAFDENDETDRKNCLDYTNIQPFLCPYSYYSFDSGDNLYRVDYPELEGDWTAEKEKYWVENVLGDDDYLLKDDHTQEDIDFNKSLII